MITPGTYSVKKSRRAAYSSFMAYRVLVVITLLICLAATVKAQDEPLYDEISVYVKLPYCGNGRG
jgi:hypothetical protein